MTPSKLSMVGDVISLSIAGAPCGFDAPDDVLNFADDRRLDT